MARTRRLLLVASALLGGIFAMGGTATAKPATTSIGPNQHFVGLVNGKATKATVVVACPGPISIGKTGHPVGGTIAVEPPSTVAGTTGYTGSRGHSVVATFVVPVPVTTTSTVTFTRYGSQAIPSTLLLPCSGSGTVVFAPAPTSKTAKNAKVSVSFVNITVDPPAAASTAVTPSRTITVTQADSGHTYRLHKGDGLDVQLSSPSNFVWTEPASSNQTVLQRTGGSSGTMATGTFVARSLGRAQVTAIGTPNCSGACPTVILAFEVNVTVVD
jgi:hypothetical protein